MSRLSDFPTTYSFIVPIYNEAENIAELHRRLLPILEQLDAHAEVILINDGSKDQSLAMLRELHKRDSRFLYISLARNFGHQIAVTAGLSFVKGKAVIVLDADLQDPPELIPRLIEQWQAGFQVVYAQRIKRKKEGWLKRLVDEALVAQRRTFIDKDVHCVRGGVER
ncbi:MAG: glycosyltransferase family 2 protein, partial [Cyanobacteria bacterium P01_H01_bin.121]